MTNATKLAGALCLAVPLALAACADTEPPIAGYEPPIPETAGQENFKVMWTSTELDAEAADAGTLDLEPLVVAEVQAACQDEPQILKTAAERVSLGTFSTEPAVRVWAVYTCTPARAGGGAIGGGSDALPDMEEPAAGME